MTSTRNPELRKALAQRIWALRELQRGHACPRFWLQRVQMPRVLATVLADTSLDHILERACEAWQERAGLPGEPEPELLIVTEDASPADTEAAAARGEVPPARGCRASMLAVCEQRGLDLAAIRLVAREEPVPWLDSPQAVFDLVDDVLASDEQYAAALEECWQEHQRWQLRSEEEQTAFTTYLALKKRFG